MRHESAALVKFSVTDRFRRPCCIQRAGLATDLLPDADDAEFAAYPSQLRRVFENLYWNALDHGDATLIRVGTLDRGGFYVEDDGSGVPAAERDIIFEAWALLKSSTGDMFLEPC
ncbi:ATP-binding protein [Haloplanus aerogenes]|uniref:Sensor histidine kinase n=1 Tax=Haloplanus aerogenes TaxID=660522 RepID=A0A3G8QV71_9EURY|nr:ATP-binding protein [Haloplanus aerogenes]AZH24704.1 sensor histidine kinase [Haloplanus aerogenes]